MKTIYLLYVETLQGGFANDDFVGLAFDAEGMASFDAGILKPFAAEYNAGKKGTNAAAASEGFVANGEFAGGSFCGFQ